jgi:hypothetical protein
MSEKDWIRGPLWKEICQFLDLVPEGGNNGALALYERTENVLNVDIQKAELLSLLSPSQINSLRIIQEWWNGSIEEDEWFANATNRVKILEVLDIFPALDLASPLVLQMLLGIGPVIPQVSTYRLEIFRLFQMEFDMNDLGTEDEAKYFGFLQKQRERSAFYSSVQRTTFAFRPQTGHPDNNTEYPDNSKSKVGSSQLDTIYSNVPIGACIEACPWLGFRKSHGGYPFFLWDTQHQRTVIVDDMDSKPEYICISHTWGRWLDPAKPPTTVSGVPWLVPQNTIFKVQELPHRLRDAFPTKYLWFDLLCIPQDGSERALLEISRQADIFGNASAVVAWLNDINDWTGLRQTTEWLCRFCLSSYGATEPGLPDIDASQHTGLVIRDSSEDIAHSHIPGGWFTSLWTLQEACLRPDMLLCNKNFELLVIGYNVPTVVSLDALAALLNFAIHHYNQGPFETILNNKTTPEKSKPGTVLEYEDFNKSSPKRQRWILEKLPVDAVGVLELYDALVMSGMNKLFKVSPATILNLGQHRQCNSRRAEAIMSVIGATQWYTTHVDKYKTSPAEDDLVLGYYPAPFLNEVATKLGAQFFANVSSDLSILESVVNTEGNHWIPRDTCIDVGSLLPFMSGETTLVAPEYESTSIRSHLSVQKWMILPGGEVKIQEVGILSSSAGNYDSELQASILVPGMFSTTAHQQCDLHEWIRNFRPGPLAENFAISLYQPTAKFHWGLILKQVGVQNRLVKIGTFFTDILTVDEVPSQIVDWIVL